MVRSKKCFLEQIVNRIHESNCLDNNNSNNLSNSNLKISCKNPNNYYLTNTDKFIEVLEIKDKFAKCKLYTNLICLMITLLKVQNF